jgi:hypothetical protein
MAIAAKHSATAVHCRKHAVRPQGRPGDHHWRWHHLFEQKVESPDPVSAPLELFSLQWCYRSTLLQKHCAGCCEKETGTACMHCVNSSNCFVDVVQASWSPWKGHGSSMQYTVITQHPPAHARKQACRPADACMHCCCTHCKTELATPLTC